MTKAKKGVTFNHNPLLRSELPAWRPRFVLLCLLGAALATSGCVMGVRRLRRRRPSQGNARPDQV